ncbi:hypothetical protein Bca4012_063659 [Brassica carinata]
MHHESTFAMETQVVKIEKSHKEASKGTPRRVRLDDDDQDDHNELALFLAKPSDPERKKLSTNCVKLNQLQGHSATDDIGAWIAVSDDGSDSKKSVRKWKALDRLGDSDAALLPIQTNQARSSNGQDLYGVRRGLFKKKLPGWYGVMQRPSKWFQCKSVANPFKLQFKFFFYVFL